MAANDVVDQVLAQVSDARERLALLVGSALEGGWGPTFNVGDNGTSFGPFQEHYGGWLPMPTSSVQAQQLQARATDPARAVADAAPRYAAAVTQIPDALWRSDPEQAAEQAAVIAERPAQPYYDSEGQKAVDAAYSRSKKAIAAGGGGGWSLNPITDVRKVVGDVGGLVGKGAGAAGGAVESAVGGAVGAVWNDAKPFLLTTTFVVLGLGLVAIGAYQAAKPKLRQTAEQAETVLPAAAAAA